VLPTSLGPLAVRVIRRIPQWWWKNTLDAWTQAWREPDVVLRIVLLGFGSVLFYYVGQHAFQYSLLTGFSFIAASFLVISRATVFLIVRGVPLGVVAPILIFSGVIFSQALRPVIFEARDSAVEANLMAAAIVMSVVTILGVFANRLKRGELSDDWGPGV